MKCCSKSKIQAQGVLRIHWRLAVGYHPASTGTTHYALPIEMVLMPVAAANNARLSLAMIVR